MKIYICNALAMGMLDREVQSRPARRVPTPITLEAARQMVRSFRKGDVTLVGAVGHADTARLIADALSLPVAAVHGRITIRLSGNGRGRNAERALIGAYTGPRLPEGCTTLPDGTLEWWII